MMSITRVAEIPILYAGKEFFCHAKVSDFPYLVCENFACSEVALLRRKLRLELIVPI